MAADYTKIPAHILPGLELYLKEGYDPGYTLRSAIANDLFAYAGSADPETLAATQHIAGWIVNRIPPQARGSREKVERWRGQQ